MTQLEFLLANRDWCNKWMDTPEDQLPGKLTHEKIEAVYWENDEKLMEFQRWSPTKGWIYLDPETDEETYVFPADLGLGQDFSFIMVGVPA